jgi:hypothetical protein
MDFDLKIAPIKTSKDKIKQNDLMMKEIILKHPHSAIFNGRTKSGKSVLVCNLLMKPHFYGTYYDNVYIISPTADSPCDDTYADLKNVEFVSDIKESIVQQILDFQKAEIEEKGIDKAPKALLVYDDCQSYSKFLKSGAVVKSFIMNRHFNLSTWLLGQSYTSTPRKLRLQASGIFFFKGSGSEVEKITEEYARPGSGKSEFMEMVDFATKDAYSFLFINNQAPIDTRYRKNLDEIIQFN